MIYKNITFKADPFSYNLEFDDRITLVGGNSGTGKTVLYEMLEDLRLTNEYKALYAAARRRHFCAAREAVRFREHYAAYDVSAHVRSDFHVSDCSVRIHGKSFLYFRQRAVELYVHDRPGYAYYPSFHASVSLVFLAFCALAPAAISVISCVIAAWRTRL